MPIRPITLRERWLGYKHVHVRKFTLSRPKNGFLE